MSNRTPTTYSDWAADRIPRWLRGPVDGWGDRFIRSFGEVLDGFTESMRDAVRARYPSVAPDDAIPYHAIDRGLAQYPPETLNAWRERIGRAWEQWVQAGRPDGLLYQLERYCTVSVVEIAEHATDPLTPGDGNARFVVVIGDGVDAGSLPWGPLTMPFTPSGGDVTLGSTATATEVSQVRAVVRRWKAAHSYLVAVVLKFVGATVVNPYWPRDPANPDCAWLGGNSTLSIGIRTMPFTATGYREDIGT